MPDDNTEDLDGIAAALQKAFPDLTSLAPLKFLASGASSLVVESQGGHVFRVGKNRESPRSYQKEPSSCQ